MMKSLFLLVDEARERLKQNSHEFNDKFEIVLSILRSSGAVPYRRSTLNGHVHKLLSACIVHAVELGETFRMTSRMHKAFHDMNISTKFVSYLDKLVEEKLLSSNISNEKAEGDLTVSNDIAKFLTNKPVF